MLNNECLGVVLAGGLSTRMGQDKAKLAYKNTDMLNFSQQLLLDSGINNVVISGNHYQVPDKFKNAGPVGGIYSVIEQYQPSAILVLPVDLPLMKPSGLTQLRLTGEMSQKACFFEDNNIPLYLPNNGYLELFLSKEFRQFNASECHTKKNGPSIKALLNQIPHMSIKPQQNRWLFNSNTPEQWEQAKTMC